MDGRQRTAGRGRDEKIISLQREFSRKGGVLPPFSYIIETKVLIKEVAFLYIRRSMLM